MTTPVRHVTAGILDVAYHEAGRPDGTPVICLHGFPYDAHAFDEVAALLPNHRVIIPYLRGYGPTRFLSPDTLRSGEQAALAADLLSLLDALDIPQRHPGRLRLGRPRSLHRRGPAPGTHARAGHLRRLPHPGHRKRRRATAARGRAPPLVSILLPHRPRPRRPNPEPPGPHPLSLAPMVPNLALHGRHLRADRRGVRQPGFRGHLHPLLSPPVRPCPGRSRLPAYRARAVPPASHHDPRHHAPRRRRRRLPAQILRSPRAPLHRKLPAPPATRHWPQHPPGSSASLRRRHPRSVGWLKPGTGPPG